jgi:acyl carrier protein
MNIVFDTTDSVTIRFARRSGHALADTLTVNWDAADNRVVVSATRPDAHGRSGDVYSADLTTLALDNDVLFEYRQRFDSLLRMSVIERVDAEGDCRLSEHYSEAGIAELVADLNREFAELMDGPMDGWAVSDEAITANDLYGRLMARIAAKTGQKWHIQPGVATSSGTLDRLVAIIADHLDRPYEQVAAASGWTWDDLGTDSLDMMELVMAAEEEFGVEIEDEKVDATTCVRDLAALVDELMAAPAHADGEPSDEIVEAFKTAFHRHHDANPLGTYEDNVKAGLSAALRARGRIDDVEEAP